MASAKNLALSETEPIQIGMDGTEAFAARVRDITSFIWARGKHAIWLHSFYSRGLSPYNARVI
jgi:hypothetical protein